VTITEDIRTDPGPYVDTAINYSERAAKGGTIFGSHEFSFKLEQHPARIYNARRADVSFEKNGFTLLKRKTDVNLADQAEAEKRYYPAVRQMVQEITGAREVFAFMGMLRGGEQEAGGGPALSAHVDFTEFSLHGWIDRLVPDRADELKQKRLININVWRPVKPVERSPLALCDKNGVEPDDFLDVYFMSPDGKSRSPAGLNMAYSPRHRWYYYPDMQPDEVLVFQLLDTRDPEMRMTGHTAFNDPTSPKDAAPRVSYEIRTIAVFE
jgi:hypothetical protein